MNIQSQRLLRILKIADKEMYQIFYPSFENLQVFVNYFPSLKFPSELMTSQNFRIIGDHKIHSTIKRKLLKTLILEIRILLQQSKREFLLWSIEPRTESVLNE